MHFFRGLATDFDFMSYAICQQHKLHSYLTQILKLTWSVTDDDEIMYLNDIINSRLPVLLSCKEMYKRRHNKQEDASL
jgi:hypothetical protein